jgi:hypothetical protein
MSKHAATYTIERVQHGLVVRGFVRLSDLPALIEFARALRLTQVDVAVSVKLEAVMVMASEAGSRAWRAELGLPSEGLCGRIDPAKTAFANLVGLQDTLAVSAEESPEDDLERARR